MIDVDGGKEVTTRRCGYVEVRHPNYLSRTVVGFVGAGQSDLVDLVASPRGFVVWLGPLL